MSDALDPKGPAQPNLDTVYKTKGNPADQSQAEQSQANSPNAGDLVEKRERGDVPVRSSHGQGPTPSSLGYGASDSSQDKDDGSKPASNTEGEQMRAPGEGEVYDAVNSKTGFGEQDDLASDLDRKKQEQSGAREEIKEQRQEKVDVGGALGQRGGPVVPEGR